MERFLKPIEREDLPLEADTGGIAKKLQTEEI
jgi:hypothetical protein